MKQIWTKLQNFYEVKNYLREKSINLAVIGSFGTLVY